MKTSTTFSLERMTRLNYGKSFLKNSCLILSKQISPLCSLYDDTTRKGSVIIQGMEEVTVHNKNEVSVFFTKIPGSPPNQILLLSVGLQYFSQGLPQAPDSRHVDECTLEPLAYHLLHYSPHQREYRRR